MVDLDHCIKLLKDKYWAHYLRPICFIFVIYITIMRSMRDCHLKVESLRDSAVARPVSYLPELSVCGEPIPQA